IADRGGSWSSRASRNDRRGRAVHDPEEAGRGRPRSRPRPSDKKLADGCDRRNLVSDDFVVFRLRLGRRQLLQLAERILEVAAAALRHRIFGLPEANGERLAVWSLRPVPADEARLTAGSA